MFTLKSEEMDLEDRAAGRDFPLFRTQIMLAIVLSALLVCFLSFMVYWEDVNKPAIRIINEAKLMVQTDKKLSDNTVQFVTKQFEQLGNSPIEISATSEMKRTSEFIKVHLVVPPPSSMPTLFKPLWVSNKSFQTVGAGKID